MKTEVKVLIALLSVCCLFCGIEAMDDSDAKISPEGWIDSSVTLSSGEFNYSSKILYEGSDIFSHLVGDKIELNLKDLNYVSVVSLDPNYVVKSVNPTNPGQTIEIDPGELSFENYEHGYLISKATIQVALNVEWQGVVTYIPQLEVPVTIATGFEIKVLSHYTYDGLVHNVLDGYLQINNVLVNALYQLYEYDLTKAPTAEKDENGNVTIIGSKVNSKYIEFSGSISEIDADVYCLEWKVPITINNPLIVNNSPKSIPGESEWAIDKRDVQSALKDDLARSVAPLEYQQLFYTGKKQGPTIDEMWDIKGNGDKFGIWDQLKVKYVGVTKAINANVETDSDPYVMTVNVDGSKNYYGSFVVEWHIWKASITESDVEYKSKFKSVPIDPLTASEITIKKNGVTLVENSVVKSKDVEMVKFEVKLNESKNAFIVYYEDNNHVTNASCSTFKTKVVKNNEEYKCVEDCKQKSGKLYLYFEVNIVTLDGILLVNTIKLNGPITKETFDNKVFIYALGYVLDPEDYTLTVNDGWGRSILVDDEPGEINTTSSELNHIVLKGNEDRGYTGTLEGWFRVTPDVGYEFSQGGIVYKVTSLSSKTLSVIGYEDGITDMKIPATVDNPIGDNGFKVTRIADKAFYTCTDLQSIDLGPVTNVGLKAFANCVALESADLSSVKYIGAYSFFRCTGLTSVSFSDGLKSIGKSAFSGVSFDGKSAAVGDLAGKKFVGADGKLKLDNKGIVNGTEFSVDSLVYTVTDAKKKIVAVSGYEGEIIAVAVPATVEYDGATFAVKSIADNAFKGCKTLKSIDVSNVESIGFKAFANCDSLQYIDLVGEVKYIGAYAFFGCSALKMVDFGDGLKSIGAGAFGGITFVDASGKTISQSVSKLKGHIFAGSEKVLKLVA